MSAITYLAVSVLMLTLILSFLISLGIPSPDLAVGECGHTWVMVKDGEGCWYFFI